MKPLAVERLMVIGIYAGMLHDICRDEQNNTLNAELRRHKGYSAPLRSARTKLPA